MDDLGAPQFWETSICRILEWDRVIRKKHLALNYGVTRGDRVFFVKWIWKSHSIPIEIS